eukprot:scaffold31326_cov90-Isochrysis_galbana.AAC.1
MAARPRAVCRLTMHSPPSRIQGGRPSPAAAHRPGATSPSLAGAPGWECAVAAPRTPVDSDGWGGLRQLTAWQSAWPERIVWARPHPCDRRAGAGSAYKTGA